MLNPHLASWYVLYVKPRHEKKVNSRLVDSNVQTYLPLVKKLKIWSDRKKIVFEPLFTSYIFVFIQSKEDFTKCLNTAGACFFVRFGKQLGKIRVSEIEAIKKILELDYKDVVYSTNEPTIGEVKTITTGVLAGHDCEILQVINKKEIVVHLDSLQMKLTATIPAYYLSEH